MPEAINLAQPEKNPKHIREGLKEWSQANPAEQIEAMQRRGELKHLKAKHYDRAYRPRLAVRTQTEVDALEGCGFRFGDRVTATSEQLQAVSLAGGITEGYVEGIRDGFVKVNGQYYAANRWKVIGR